MHDIPGIQEMHGEAGDFHTPVGAVRNA
jgi:hypothetical protein